MILKRNLELFKLTLIFQLFICTLPVKHSFGMLRQCSHSNANTDKLKNAAVLRHRYHNTDDMQLAQSELLEVAHHSTNPREISEAYLGIAKILDRQRKYSEGIEFGRMSLKCGEPNDLRTIVWLANNPRVLDNEKQEIANHGLKLKKSDVHLDDQPFLSKSKGFILIGLGNAHIESEKNYQLALKISQGSGDHEGENDKGDTETIESENKENSQENCIDPNLQAKALIGLGNYYGSQRQCGLAVEYLYRALAVVPLSNGLFQQIQFALIRNQGFFK